MGCEAGVSAGELIGCHCSKQGNRIGVSAVGWGGRLKLIGARAVSLGLQ